MLSEQMQELRIGVFTASGNHRLMAGWETKLPPKPESELFDAIQIGFNNGDEKFLVGDYKPSFPGVTAKDIKECVDWLKTKQKIETPPVGLVTYAHEKAEEELYHLDPTLGNWSTVHTRNGEERELECMELLQDELNVKFDNIGDDQAHIQNDGVGVTPDGLKNDELGLVEWGVEGKCKSPHEHTNLLLISNNDELKKEAFEHFVQCQTGMLVTNAKYWLFVAYHPFGKTSEIKMSYFFVERDDEFISILSERIALAKKIKAERLAALTKSLESRKAQKQKVIDIIKGIDYTEVDEPKEQTKHEAELDLEV